MIEEDSFFESLRGVKIGGRYTVDRVLGEGGMGIVALGRYPELEQKVAIKFLRPEHAVNATLNARFVREGRLAAKVKSEHFVRVFDIGKLDNGVPYLVMELLAGCDLGDELGARGPLPIEVAVDYALQAMIGLAEIHALGVVHRDLKPSNLFLAEAAGKRMIKVLDFGISKESKSSSGEALTSTENLLGTPHYMSPEQVRASRDVDPRSDIWSLGVILYELVTGKRPFASDENATGELFAKILYVDPPAPSTHRPDLPPELESIILRCLKRERPERFADVGELAEALRPFATDASRHRIEAVRQAATVQGSMPPPREPPAPADELPPTAIVPTSKAVVEVAENAPQTAMTTAADASLRPAIKPLGRMIAVFAAVIVAAAVTLVVLATRKPAPPLPKPAVVATSSPPPSATPAETSAAPVVAATSAVVTATPSASHSSIHVVATPPKPRPLAPSAKPASTGDIILDRK